MTIGTGTAASTKALFAMLAMSGPATVSAIPDAFTQARYAEADVTVTSISPLLKATIAHLPTDATPLWSSPKNLRFPVGETDRQTTAHERLIGEIRRYTFRSADWDGQGAETPLPSSLQESIDFIGLLKKDSELPEAMLFSSGHSGLFWETDSLYADLKFLGGGRIAYFIEHSGEGKHKGIAYFDSQKMPAVFQALIQA